VIMTTEVGAWRVAIQSFDFDYVFEEVDRLLDREVATGFGQLNRGLTVEIRRNAGPMMPWALLSGTYTPSIDGSFSVAIGHTGEFPEESAPNVLGLLGRKLQLGLPLEFAQSVMDGILRFDSEDRPAGRVEVVGGCFDPVYSSEASFEVAAGLLKWALLLRSPLSEKALTEFVDRLSREL
jgi:hypothetical protein